MVSKANEDFPDPDNPVITINLFLGNSISISFKLCARAFNYYTWSFHVTVTLLILVQTTYLLTLLLSRSPILLLLFHFFFDIFNCFVVLFRHFLGTVVCSCAFVSSFSTVALITSCIRL